MRTSNKLQPRDRILPPGFRFLIEFDFDRRLTWKERWQILFGYGLKIQIKAAAEHSTGKFTPKMVLSTTMELKPAKQETL